jgi:hypothetical protein
LYDKKLCGFPIIIKDFCKDGLPDPAVANTLYAKGINVGALPDLPVLRVSSSPCSSIVSSYTVQGKGWTSTQGNPDDGSQISWKGGFLLVRPAGQTSLDPTIPDKVASLFVLSGIITFQGDDFTVLKYAGTTPVDVCKMLA